MDSIKALYCRTDFNTVDSIYAITFAWLKRKTKIKPQTGPFIAVEKENYSLKMHCLFKYTRQ